MSSRRRSISRNTRPRSVKIPISFLHASARERALASVDSFVDSFAVDTRTGPPAMYRRPPVRFSNGQCISAGRGKIALLTLAARDLARGNARGKRSKDRISRRQRSGISPYPMDRQCAKGEKKKLRARRETRFHNHRALPVRARTIIGRRCEIERLI